MVLSDRVGEVIDRFRFPLTSQVVDDFRTSLRAPDAGIPPTVLQAAALHRNVVPHLAIGLHAERVRHAQQRFSFARPLRPATLDVSVRLDEVYMRDAATGQLLFATIGSEFSDQDGLVATSHMSVVELPREPSSSAP